MPEEMPKVEKDESESKSQLYMKGKNVVCCCAKLSLLTKKGGLITVEPEEPNVYTRKTKSSAAIPAFEESNLVKAARRLRYSVQRCYREMRSDCKTDCRSKSC